VNDCQPLGGRGGGGGTGMSEPGAEGVVMAGNVEPGEVAWNAL
jgi:hypothetical protein